MCGTASACMMALDIHASVSAAAAIAIAKASGRLSFYVRIPLSPGKEGMTMGRTCESWKPNQSAEKIFPLT